jgi:hypothetical protein
MRLIEVREFEREDPEKENKIRGLKESISRIIMPGLEAKYGGRSIFVNSMAFHVAEIQYLLGDLEGKKILDLGCGSVYTTGESAMGRGYLPWVCRILHQLKAKVIGIDWNPQEGEEFENYKIDLYGCNSLKQFYGGDFDLACALSLFDSPSLHLVHGWGAGRNLFDRMSIQLERVLKKKGIFFFDATGTGLVKTLGGRKNDN